MTMADNGSTSTPATPPPPSHTPFRLEKAEDRAGNRVPVRMKKHLTIVIKLGERVPSTIYLQ
jgi:hypothetical protein